MNLSTDAISGCVYTLHIEYHSQNSYYLYTRYDKTQNMIKYVSIFNIPVNTCVSSMLRLLLLLLLYNNSIRCCFLFCFCKMKNGKKHKFSA